MIECLDNSHFSLHFTLNTMSKLAEAVALHTCTWRYLLSVSVGTQITLMFLKYYLSPSRTNARTVPYIRPRSLPHPIQFTVHYHPIILYYTVCDSTVK